MLLWCNCPITSGGAAMANLQKKIFFDFSWFCKLLYVQKDMQ